MMRSASKSAEKRLTRWETLGAWLHIWTAPKDVEVPPIPWRKVALYGTGLAIVVAIAAALIIPPLNEGKAKGAAERARAQAQALAAERARLRADQKIHTLKVTPADEKAMVPALERAVTADAQSRVDAGTIKGPVIGTTCEAAGVAVIQFPKSRVYKCFVKSEAGIPGEGSDILSTGYPFIATIYASAGKITWCKENPQPDEKGRRLVGVRISPVCAGKLSEVL